MSIVFSGMQPSGEMHLGNYLGMVQPILDLQQKAKDHIILSVVDLHAITVWNRPDDLQSNCLDLVASLIATGFDANKNILFIQSQVSEHAELLWILSGVARIGWLNRMTQFKDKVGKNKEQASAGLYFYPVLMAADILLYDADKVPIGEDQKQHIEFARDIAIKFNHDYKSDLFKIPEPITSKNLRIMSLKDGSKKMSKSDPSSSSKILINDSNELIESKIMKAKTDSMNMPTIHEDLSSRPEVRNLLNIYTLTYKVSFNEAIERFASSNYVALKKSLIEKIIDLIAPVRLRYNEIRKDEKALTKVLEFNLAKAKSIARAKLLKVKNLIGFLT